MATPLDHSKPLWDVYLIDGVGSGCALLTRIHHCVADGIALARVMLTLTDAGPAAKGAERWLQLTSPRIGGALTRGARAGRRACARAGSRRFCIPRRSAATLGSDAQTLAKLLFGPNDDRSAVRGELSGMRRVAWSKPIPLEQIKSIAQRTEGDRQRRPAGGSQRRATPLHA